MGTPDKKFTRRTFLQVAGGSAMAAAGPAILGGCDKSGSKRPVTGSGDHTYEVIHDWGEVPERIRYGNTHGVCIDSQGYIYIHHTVHESSESDDTMVVFDPAGKFVKSWGSEFKNGAHGLHIQKEGNEEFLYLCDINRNLVVKTTLDGEVVFTLGYPEESEAYKPNAKGEGIKYRPTNVAVAPGGDIYVGDGYGSSYINRYNSGGEFIQTIAEKGSEAGQVNCPHGIMVDSRGDESLLLIADRTNKRLQYFSLDGEHLKFDGGVSLPCHFDTFGDELLVPDLDARVTIMGRENRVITHLCEGLDDWRDRRKLSRKDFLPGKFICPHGACYDHEGSIFVVEWVVIGRVTKLQKV